MKDRKKMEEICNFRFKSFRLYITVDDFLNDYKDGKLHPGDLKNALTKSLNQQLDPVREHFKKDAQARKLLSKIRYWQELRAKEKAKKK